MQFRLAEGESEEELLEQLQATEGGPQADILPTRLADSLEARLLTLRSSISSQRALVSSTHECVGSCMYVYEHLKFRMDSITAVLASNPLPVHLEQAVARVAAQAGEDEERIHNCSLHVENLDQLRRDRAALDDAVASVTAVLEQVHTRVRGLSERVEALDLCGSLFDLETRLANASHTMEVIGRHDAMLTGIINGADHAAPSSAASSATSLSMTGGSSAPMSISAGGVGLGAGDDDGSEEFQLRLERAVLVSRLARGGNRGGAPLDGSSPLRATSDQMLDIAYEVGVLEDEVERTAGELDDIVKGLQAANKHVEMMGHKVERTDQQLWEHVEQLSLLEVVCGDLYWDKGTE
eukprot:jgi/Mesvir1/26217/Mv02400-RA.1